MKSLLFAASILLAAAFTVSCSSDNDDGSNHSYGSFTYEGKEYKTIVIGNQTWMAENLDYAVESSKCYDDDPENCTKYGRLYDWVTAMTACPSDWHLPTKDEWDLLGNSRGYSKHLKAMKGWNEGGNGLDTYGFAALPGGYGSGGYFSEVGYHGNWWTASEYNHYRAYSRDMHYNFETVGWNESGKDYLYSVRCVQN